MEIQQLTRRIVVQTIDSQEKVPRYLLRFQHSSFYRLFVRCLLHEGIVPGQSGFVRLLPNLSAACCRLAEPALLERFRRIVSVERDYPVRVDKFYLPGSGKPSLSLDPAHKIPWGVVSIRAPKLWTKTKGDRVRIGVVDTGVDYQHPDIKASLAKGINLVNRQLTAADDNGHGTHIAGTIAACGTGGIRGVAPKAILFPVKAFDKEGSAYVSDIVLAIHWCIANRMDIINMSFGMSEYSPSLFQAVKAAHRRNVIIVASSGNNGKANAVDYPAKMPYTIAVGAINKKAQIASFSNRGKEVDIYAPGEAIYSTWPGNRYNELNGTSMAAAHVSGVIALLMAVRPKMSFSRVKQLLDASALPLASSKTRKGPGRLDARRAWSLMLHKPPVAKRPVTAAKKTNSRLKKAGKSSK